MPEVTLDSRTILNTKLIWHPKFSVSYIESVGIFLLSRTKSGEQPILLPDHGFSRFIKFSEPCSLSELVQVDSYFASPDIFYVVQQLLDAGMLVESGSRMLDQYVAIKDINGSFSSAGNVHSYTKQTSKAILERFSAELISKATSANNSGNLKVVFVDDLLVLDPEIVVAHDTVLIQLNFDGVLIFPRQVGVADLALLKTRILKNQPYRNVLCKESKLADVISLPVKKIHFTDDLVDRIVEVAIDQMNQVSDSSDRLAEISVDSLNVQYHPVVFNVYQGDAITLGKNRSPVELSLVKGLNSAEGGTRVVTTVETYEKLVGLVSPISGVINQFHELPTRFHENIKIYQTGFFKIPKLTDLANTQSIQQEMQQVCLGKGASVIQSKVSALSEAIERRNAIYDLPLRCLKAKASDLKATDQRFYVYHDLVPYSDVQYMDFSDPDNSESKRRQAAQKYQDEVIDWIENWSLTNDEIVYLPLTVCQAQTGLDQERFGRWHSNGCSAGNCIEEAILQGLFELLERDATSIWWYNKVNCPAFDLALLKPSDFERFNQSLHDHYDYWVLDLTNDVGVPVMAAIAQHRVSGGFVMGFGAHLKAELAAQRALSELCQLIPIRDQHSAPFDFDKVEEESYLFPSLDKSRTEYLNIDSNLLRENIEQIVCRLNSIGLETLLFDYTKSDTPLTTVKVTVPGLCHIWPQYGNARLYEVPVKLGWRYSALSEPSLNSQALYI